MDPFICILSRSDGEGLPDDVDLTDKTKHYLALDELDFSEPGIVRAGLHIVGADRNAMAANYQAIEAKLREAVDGAAMRGPWVSLELAYRTTHSVFIDVLGGTLTPGVVYLRQGRMRAQLELRCLPYARGEAIPDAVTATLTNGSAQFLRTAVPGDHPALVKLTITDVSSSGIVNRIRLARRSAKTIAALGDFDPWVDVAALTGALTTTDATAFGGSYVNRDVTSTSFVDMARAVMPAGDRNRGRRDIWARVYDTATAMAAPTSLAASVTAPTIASTTTTPTSIEVVQTAAARVTSGTSIAPAWLAPTTTGNLLVLVVLQQLTDTPVTPSGWTLTKHVELTSEAGNLLSLSVYTIKNAAARSGSQTVAGLATATATDPATAMLIELSGAYAGSGNAIVAALSASNTADTAAIPIVGNDTAFEGQGTLAIIGTAGADTAAQLDYWQGAFVEVADSNEIVIGLRRDSAIDQVISTTVNLVAAALSWVRVVLSIRPGSTSATTYQEPLPGELLAGTYGFRVQAVDPVGTLSNATATVNAIVASDNSKIALSWVAPNGAKSHYKVTYSFGGRFYSFSTPDATTSYTMTTTEGHVEVAALPATSGVTGPSARLLPRVGTSGTPSSLLTDLPEVIIPAGARGTWRHVKLASGVDLPPVGEHLAGSRPEWAIEVQARNPNGGDSLTAEVRIDAIWTAPHDEAQATLEYPGLALATLRRWVAETERSGRSMTGWLEDTATSAEVGRITCAGAFTLEPGDNIIALLLEQASGASSLSAAVTVALSIHPRFAWIRGT